MQETSESKPRNGFTKNAAHVTHRHQRTKNYISGPRLEVVILIIFLGNIDSSLIGGYSIGYELLPINGLLNFIGLYLIRK